MMWFNKTAHLSHKTGGSQITEHWFSTYGIANYDFVQVEYNDTVEMFELPRKEKP